ncbi:hypothetical protein STAPHY8AQ_20043 [Staphylococcus sp. 8AQ]|nr:hypothetical protein STAPHY8AQ_20043 [Staphylococcus sp. 8AQ]
MLYISDFSIFLSKVVLQWYMLKENINMECRDINGMDTIR